MKKWWNCTVNIQGLKLHQENEVHACKGQEGATFVMKGFIIRAALHEDIGLEFLHATHT